jgi:hypothetical protein
MEDVSTNAIAFVQSTSGGGSLTTQRFTAPGGLASLTGWHTLAITMTAAGVTKMYLDGVSQGLTGASYSNSATTQTAQFIVGNRPDNTRSWNGYLGNLFIWDRVLSDNDVATISANPWQIFRPRVT